MSHADSKLRHQNALAAAPAFRNRLQPIHIGKAYTWMLNAASILLQPVVTNFDVFPQKYPCHIFLSFNLI